MLDDLAEELVLAYFDSKLINHLYLSLYLLKEYRLSLDQWVEDLSRYLGVEEAVNFVEEDQELLELASALVVFTSKFKEIVGLPII